MRAKRCADNEITGKTVNDGILKNSKPAIPEGTLNKGALIASFAAFSKTSGMDEKVRHGSNAGTDCGRRRPDCHLS